MSQPATGRHRLALIGDVVAALVFLALQAPVALVLVLGASIRVVSPLLYWTASAAGYVVLTAISIARPGALRALPGRLAIRTWLAAGIVAFAICWVAAIYKWPISLSGYGGHGFDAEGGEMNLVLVPWVQAMVWYGIAALRRARVVAA